MELIKVGMIVLTAALSMAAQSCNKVEPQPEGSGYPILFNSADYNTKAIVTEDNVKADGFKVYANYTLDTQDFEFIKEVTYDGKYWGYEETEYWWPGATYIFRAFYPKAGDFELSVNEAGFTLSNFDVTKQIDILYASAERSVAAEAVAPNEGSVVELNFTHLLSLVKVEIKSEISGVTINEVIFEDIAQSGTCTNGTWTSTQTATVSYSPNLALAVEADFEDATNGGFLLIPENIDGSQMVIIKTTTPAGAKEYKVKIPNKTWIGGMMYTYNATIKQENIVFNEPTVVKWDEENATGSVIIK